MTQHPVCSKTIKHLVYDCAQFIHLSFDQYCQALENQMSQTPRLLSDLQNHTDRLSPVHEMLARWENELEPPVMDSDGQSMENPQSLRRGYREYMACVKEQNNLLSRSWFLQAWVNYDR